jgi:hypothetical protein
MFNLFKSKGDNFLRATNNDNVRMIEIYRKDDRIFQMYCDAKKSEGTIGVNTNYNISLLTDNGFVQLMDNRQLGIPEVKMDDGEKKVTEDIDAGFEKFKEYANFVLGK